MSSASSSRCALRRPPPPFPLVLCPNCGRVVKQYRSGTPDHPGWVFYKCKQHGFGCNFWHWELEYIIYLAENNFIREDAAVDAIGWAEERREELELRKEEEKCTTVHGQDQHLMRLVDAVREMVVLLKIGLVVLFVLCALCVVIAVKK